MAASLESLLLALISSADVSRRHPFRPARRRRKQKNTMALTKRRDLRSHMEKRVRALRRLVPNGESMELHGLFREATDYIACLQARIKSMQTMVKVLSDGSSKATRKAPSSN